MRGPGRRLQRRRQGGARAQPRDARLEKLLARDGFKVEPAYRALQRSGSETGARFALPGGATLALDCKPNADESRHRCDLVATREKRRAVVVAGIYDEMPSFISMNWIENVYADPAARSVIAVERFAGASEPGSGLRVLELAEIERALRVAARHPEPALGDERVVVLAPCPRGARR